MRQFIVMPVAAGTLVAGFAMTGTALAAEQTVYQCTQGGVERRVEVVRDPSASPVCEVWYDKPQESATRQRLWSAANDPDYCTAQAEAFIEKLRGWGWACQIADASALDEAAPSEAPGEVPAAPDAPAAPEAPEAPEAP